MHRFHVASILAFVALATIVSPPARASEKKAAPPLAQALEDWIVLLEKNDAQTARDRWAASPEAAKALTDYWDHARQCHKDHDYRAWLDKKPGTDPARFTLGGHEFGHLHVVWQKTDRGWRIGQVFMCR